MPSPAGCPLLQHGEAADIIIAIELFRKGCRCWPVKEENILFIDHGIHPARVLDLDVAIRTVCFKLYTIFSSNDIHEFTE